MKTLTGKSLFLKDIYSHDFWFVLGGPSSWEDENVPPVVNNLIKEIDNPIICIQSIIKKYVKIDMEGEYKYGGMKLKEITEDQIFSEYPDYIYIEIEMDDTLLNDNEYWRQTGIYCDLIRADNISLDRTVLYPNLNEVKNFGYLISYENHPPKHIETGQTRKLVSIIEI